MLDEEIYKQAIAVYGATEQENIAIEECAELIQAIIHKHRGRRHNIAEEIADVEIMIEQLKIINDCPAMVDVIKRSKIKRLQRRLRGEIND